MQPFKSKMMVLGRFRLFLAAMFLWSVLSIFGGIAHAEDTDHARGRDALRWGRISVLPFYNMTDIHGQDASVRGPLSRQVFVTGKVLTDANLMMNKMVERRLAKEAGLSWMATRESGFISLQPSTTKTAHLSAISSHGRRQGADHVLTGYLYAFRRRDGGNLGVQIPAKVIFELVLTRTDSERVVWQQRFNETQQALSDNLLNIGKFIRRKGRWIRAHEMADHAVREMLDEMFVTRPPARK